VPREPLDAKRARAAEILDRLERAYPSSTISLRYGNDFQLLVAVILSAQCTDAMVNKVTRRLFKKYRTVDDFAQADRATLEREIHSTGFYRNKAKAVIEAAKTVRDRFGGTVPSTMEDLDSIPGVARKTANVVLHTAFGKAEGIAVDTHVTRIANLLRLTHHEDPVKIEADLGKLVPREKWGRVTHLIIDHGRAVCIARRPRCEACVLNDLCPSALRPRLADSA
jgi:endonuclease III